ANSITDGACLGAPQAFFSIDATTHVDEFNNCANGADYGDWITHTPSEVQDGITNGTGSPFLTLTSPETRALDVIGYRLAAQPAITAITPSSALPPATFDATITGTNLTGATAVTFRGTGVTATIGR